MAQSHCSFADGIFCCDKSATCSTWVSRSTYVLDLVLVQRRYPIDDDPRKTSTKVHDLVHEKAHDSSGQHIISNEGVPRSPQLLKVVQVDVVLGDLVKLMPICVLRVREHNIGYALVSCVGAASLLATCPRCKSVCYEQVISHRHSERHCLMSCAGCGIADLSFATDNWIRTGRAIVE